MNSKESQTNKLVFAAVKAPRFSSQDYLTQLAQTLKYLFLARIILSIFFILFKCS